MTTPDNHARATEKRSAWREPMVWVIAVIPASAVIATTLLLLTASRYSGNNDAVPDQVRRTAQIQVSDLGPDAKAKQLRLSAIVRADKTMVEVLPVDGAFDRDMPLTLALHHPSRAALDRTLELLPASTGWRADEAIDLSHDWNVQLGAPDGTWRLLGRWDATRQATYLRPAVAGD
ncbi:MULTISPECIES: FixH family protein [unclassified Pseudoxanthomonas]|uniref:FixH family protein n=1 Tax=unclassified Pseudoxanthomonas TaxID=2645906 RepID=UPI003077AEC6